VGRTDRKLNSVAPNGKAVDGGSKRRRQHAGFSVFLDQIIDESGETHWETRLYHAESGAETTLPGKAPDQWISWIVDRMRPAGRAGMPPEAAENQAAVEVASVEILDVTFLGDDAAGGESLHTIKAQLVVQLSGLASLEREIGSSVLRRIASRSHNRRST
jgi:hypothetical protein